MIPKKIQQITVIQGGSPGPKRAVKAKKEKSMEGYRCSQKRIAVEICAIAPRRKPNKREITKSTVKEYNQAEGIIMPIDERWWTGEQAEERFRKEGKSGQKFGPKKS